MYMHHNLETQIDRQLYWIDAIKKLYSQGGELADENLFFENDFRFLVDILVRVIERSPDGAKLRVPLECYLVLSCSKRMEEMYKLGDIQEYLSQIDCQELGVGEIAD